VHAHDRTVVREGLLLWVEASVVVVAVAVVGQGVGGTRHGV